MLRTRAREEFNKNRKIIVREVPPVTYDEVKSYMGPFAVSNIAISKRLRHAIVELKHGQEAESAIEFLADKKLLNSEVKASLFRQDNLLCVEGIPDDWGLEDFRGFVAPHGGIEKCFLWVDEEDKSLGYGFVEYVHNKDLSEVARFDLDRCQLHSGHVTRCRFVKDHVTSFDQLQSMCIVVTNLPLEIGVERFYHLLLTFGNGAIKPINYQVGIATGTTMERFGAAEFDSPEAAKIMRRRINGRFYPIKKDEEGEEPMLSQNQSKAELKASFCTPGESIDEVMKNMTSLSNQVKQLGTNQGAFNQSQAKLVHPTIQGILKGDQKAMSDFQSILEHMGSSNKDISDHMNNIHFQTAVLSLMMSSSKNNSMPYNPQKLCSLTATILKSMSSNSNNISNKMTLKKVTHQSKMNRSSSNCDPVLTSQPAMTGRCVSTNCPRDPSMTSSSNLSTCNFSDALPKHSMPFEAIPKTAFPSTSPSIEAQTQPPMIISSTTEITSPWKLLPSFARPRHVRSAVETFEQKTDEPYPGFDTDLAYVVHFLQTKEVPSSLTAFMNDGSSHASLTGDVPALCFSSSESVCHPIRQPVLSTDGNFLGSSKNVRPQFVSLQHPPESKFHFADRSNSWNPSSLQLTFPDLQRGTTDRQKDSMFFSNTRAPAKTLSLDLQQNATCNNSSKKKKWRPKVVEQCWNNLIQNNSENLATASFHFDASLFATKKRRALSENQNNNNNNITVDGDLFLDSNKLLVQRSFPKLTSAPPQPSLSGFAKNLEIPVEILPSCEDSSHESAYVGQHQQGLGGLYADSLLRKRGFREVLDAQCKPFF